jgi:hypothetical protein
MTLPTYAVTRKRIWIVKLNLRKYEAQVDQVLQGQLRSTRLPSFIQSCRSLNAPTVSE